MHEVPDPGRQHSIAHPPAPGTLRERLWRIIFLSDTKAGRAFDVALLWIIGASVVVVMLESVDSLRAMHGTAFFAVEWIFTAVFTLEYLLRLWVVRRPWLYARSFFGVIDLLAFLPAYLELVLTGSHYLMMLRVLRLLRMFRVLKMAHHMGEAGVLLNALRASRAKISVFLFSVLALVCVEGTVMYLIEESSNPGFRNIPQSIYWAIVTITTVGYGDVAPVTVLGKMMASVIMLTGFAILADRSGDGRAWSRNDAPPACRAPLRGMRLGGSRFARALLPAMRHTPAVMGAGSPAPVQLRSASPCCLGSGRHDFFRRRPLLQSAVRAGPFGADSFASGPLAPNRVEAVCKEQDRAVTRLSQSSPRHAKRRSRYTRP
jgi:voltage-gated potassium channel